MDSEEVGWIAVLGALALGMAVFILAPHPPYDRASARAQKPDALENWAGLTSDKPALSSFPTAGNPSASLQSGPWAFVPYIPSLGGGSSLAGRVGDLEVRVDRLEGNLR
jgi:hypothetical protein